MSTHKCACRRKSAGNLLMNPGFDTMAQVVPSWIDADEILGTVWTPEDSDGCPESGSIFGNVQATSNCVPVSPGVLYHFGLRFKSASALDPMEMCRMVAYTDPSCQVTGMSFSLVSPSLLLPLSTSWKTASSSWVVPPTFVAAIVACGYGASGFPGSGANSYIDQVYLNAIADSF
jgi:hypothetical protein